jgi:hypothetical protein
MTEAARKRWTLVTVNAATFMLLLDITVVNTALPAIEHSSRDWRRIRPS